MSNFIPSPNPSKSPLWNVLKVTLEPSDHLVWSWGPPGGHGLVGHLTHFQIFLAFFQSFVLADGSLAHIVEGATCPDLDLSSPDLDLSSPDLGSFDSVIQLLLAGPTRQRG